MNVEAYRSISVYVICEGQTEQLFVGNVLAPVFADRCIFLNPCRLGAGGDVKFDKFCSNVRNFLKQENTTYVTPFIDFYGVNGAWPDLEKAKRQNFAEAKFETFCSATVAALKETLKAEFSPQCIETRFIPYVSMHEFEALLFSDYQILADYFGGKSNDVARILKKNYASPEEINDSVNTAPSKRIDKISQELRNRNFQKTRDGLTLAQLITLETMRTSCPLFNRWLEKLESLTPLS